MSEDIFNEIQNGLSPFWLKTSKLFCPSLPPWFVVLSVGSVNMVGTVVPAVPAKTSNLAKSLEAIEMKPVPDGAPVPP